MSIMIKDKIKFTFLIYFIFNKIKSKNFKTVGINEDYLKNFTKSIEQK